MTSEQLIVLENFDITEEVIEQLTISITEDDEICINNITEKITKKIIINDDGSVAYSAISKTESCEFYFYETDIPYELLIRKLIYNS